MKRFLSALAVMVAIVGALAGCSASAAYSAEERQVIDTANQLVRDECDVTFDADDFPIAWESRSMKLSSYRWTLGSSKTMRIRTL